MAKPEHLDLLRQGVEVWNERKKDPLMDPDLSEADPSQAFRAVYPTFLQEAPRAPRRAPFFGHV